MEEGRKAIENREKEAVDRNEEEEQDKQQTAGPTVQVRLSSKKQSAQLVTAGGKRVERTPAFFARAKQPPSAPPIP